MRKTPFNILGRILIFLSFLMLIPLVFFREINTVQAFVFSSLITFFTGFLLNKTIKVEKIELTQKDTFLLISLSWVFAGIFGSLPYLFCGVFSNPVNAIFETVSGFTTTGASVIGDVEAYPKAILFWRSFTHWIGGMGIIIIGVAILPGLSVGGLQVLKLETTMFSEKLKPKIIETTRELFKVYLLITLSEIFLLLIAGMPFYDSILHAFGTVATGGFSPKNLSIGAYKNPWIHIIIIFFMFLSATNFILHYKALKGSPKVYWNSTEFKVYLGILVIFSLLSSMNLFFSGYGAKSFLFGTFNVTSILTTTGFTNNDFDKWPSLARGIIFLVMFLGGSTGSTTGGIKILRVVVFVKAGWREIKKLLFPHLVSPVRIDKRALSEQTVQSILNFIILYLLALGAGILFLCTMGINLESAITASAATLGVIGPGFGIVAPMSNYAGIPVLGKIVLTFLMILGRLEIFPVLVLFHPIFWKK